MLYATTISMTKVIPSKCDNIIFSPELPLKGSAPYDNI